MAENPGVGADVPVPDPTVLTTEQLLREIAQLKELLQTKMDTLDIKMTGHFLIDEQRFTKIDEKFSGIETRRIEQKRDTEEALTAALTAQKEAVGKQDDANQKAISKSEAAVADTLSKLSVLVNTQIQSLADKIDDVKDRVGRIESVKVGVEEKTTEARSQISSTTALIGAFIAVIVLALALYAGLRTPSAPSPQIVTVPTETSTP